MKRNQVIGLIIILGSFGLSLFFLKDSVFFYAMPAEQRSLYAINDPSIFKRIFNLGLDLQGGMRLVLEIDKSQLDANARKDVQDRAYTIIENRINGLGVAEPTIQKQGSDRIIIELPGLKDEQSAKRVIGSTAQLEFRLLRGPEELRRAVTVIDNIISRRESKEDLSADSAGGTVGDSAEIKKKDAQLEAQKLFEAPEEVDTLAAEQKGEKEAESFLGLLFQVQDQIGVLEKNVWKVNEILQRADVRSALERAGLGKNVFLWGRTETNKDTKEKYRILYYLSDHAELKGNAVQDAQATLARGGIEEGQAIVELELTGKGAHLFARVTAMNVGKYLAIILDSTVYSAPVIREKITGGRAQITGNFTMQEARDLAVVLRAGALPAPVRIIEERLVGPSLGQDSIKWGLFSLVSAFCAVLLFMVIYYRLSGIIAGVAMTLNLLFVFSIMAAINQTLTLPGIAGLVLTIGMSVDANVLIFERIREELALGKTIRSAIDAGYHRAFYAIFDSNVTTILTGLILFYTGTGPIKGFAVTLMLGLIVNFFTAMYATRIVFDIIISQRNIAKLSI